MAAEYKIGTAVHAADRRRRKRPEGTAADCRRPPAERTGRAAPRTRKPASCTSVSGTRSRRWRWCTIRRAPSRTTSSANPEGPDAPRGRRPPGRAVFGPQGLPMVKPPWGRITAIDLNAGEIKWMVPNGDAPDWVKNHPALQGVQLPKTGRYEHVGILVTKTLVFAGEGAGLFAVPPGSGGPMFRALRQDDRRNRVGIQTAREPERHSDDLFDRRPPVHRRGRWGAGCAGGIRGAGAVVTNARRAGSLEST